MKKLMLSVTSLLIAGTLTTTLAQNEWQTRSGLPSNVDNDAFRKGKTRVGIGNILNPSTWPAQFQVVNTVPLKDPNNASNDRMDFMITRMKSGDDEYPVSLYTPIIQIDEYLSPSHGVYTNHKIKMLMDGHGNLGLGHNVQSVPTHFSVYPLYEEDAFTMEIAHFGAYTSNGSGTISTNPRSMRFLAKLGSSSYNHLSQDGDFGIIYSDGTASGERNQDAGFVIAPWSATEGGLRLDSEGRVNIGKAYDIPNAEDYKLTVKGTILAEELHVKVHSTWPDYVFEDGYNLASLKDVKGFIVENGHLPGIPSAQEVEEEGIGLGEMNRLLLEKVEELTLHLIEQQEQLGEQQKQIEILNSKIQ